MKIFDFIDDSIGKTVHPTKEGDHFEVRRGDALLALVSRDSLEEMLRRGDAVLEPKLWVIREDRIIDTNVHGGFPRILKCDTEVNDGVVWLVPESASASKNGLLLTLYRRNPRSGKRGQVRHKDMLPTTNASVVASVSDGYGHFILLAMQPGSAIDFRGLVEEEVPDTGPSLRHPFRKPRSATNVINDGRVELSEDGNKLTFRS